MTKAKIKKLNQMTAHLFNEVRAEDILVWNPTKRTFMLGDKFLPVEMTEELLEEAKIIKSTRLWGYLVKAMQYEANSLMYKKSLSYDDMIAGKWTLWTLDVLKKKLDNISKLSV